MASPSTRSRAPAREERTQSLAAGGTIAIEPSPHDDRQQQHNDLLAIMLVTCALALTLRGRASMGAGAAVGAAAIKLTVGLALPFVLLTARRRRGALEGTAVALVVIGVPTLLLSGMHVFDQLHRIVSDPRFDIAFSGPDRLAGGMGTHIDGTVRTLCTAVAAAVALLMLARALRGADPIAAAGWVFLALIASIASLAPWYLVWPLPLAAVGRSRALSIAALLATAYLIAVHLPALGGYPWLAGPRPEPWLLRGRANVATNLAAARPGRDRAFLDESVELLVADREIVGLADVTSQLWWCRRAAHQGRAQRRERRARTEDPPSQLLQREPPRRTGGSGCVRAPWPGRELGRPGHRAPGRRSRASANELTQIV